MDKHERRVVSGRLEIRAIAPPDDGETPAQEAAEPSMLVGYAAVFGEETVVCGLWREVIAPGTFTAAIGRDDVRALYNHDPLYVLGRNRAGTLRLAEDATGLRYEIDLPETQFADDIAVSVQRGDVTQSSFAFECTAEAWVYPDPATGVLPLRTIQAVTLYDVSPVTYPAYEDTTVDARAVARAQLPPELGAMDATMIRRKRQALLEATL